jgi:Ca2+/Na+ antiporter
LKWFIGLAIFILCLFDGGATVYAIEHGIGKESNPLMFLCIETLNVDGFLFVKIFIGSIVLFLTIGFWNRFKVARVGGVVVVAVYLAVAIYHILGILSCVGAGI